MSPSELARALDLLGHAVDGEATPEQRAQAREDLTRIRAQLRDVRTSPDDVEIGRRLPVFKPSLTLLKLQTIQPRDTSGRGALDGILSWVEAQVGTRGRRTRGLTLVTDNGVWTQLLEEQPDLVYNLRA